MKIVFVALGMIAMLGSTPQDEEKKESEDRNSIEQVMKKAHGGGKNSLLSKVKSGKGSDEDKMKLLALYIDLIDNDPPEGEVLDWKMAAGRATVAAARVVVGQEGAVDELNTATNCMKCHDTHKPDN